MVVLNSIINDYDSGNQDAINQITVLQKLILLKKEGNSKETQYNIDINNKSFQPVVEKKIDVPQLVELNPPIVDTQVNMLPNEEVRIIEEEENSSNRTLSNDSNLLVKHAIGKELIKYNIKNNEYTNLTSSIQDASIFRVLIQNKTIEHQVNNSTLIRYAIIEDTSNSNSKNKISYKILNSNEETYAFILDNSKNMIIILKSSGRQNILLGEIYHLEKR
jgi:hypothetical protein